MDRIADQEVSKQGYEMYDAGRFVESVGGGFFSLPDRRLPNSEMTNRMTVRQNLW